MALHSLRLPLAFSHKLGARESTLTRRRNELLRAIVGVHDPRELSCEPALGASVEAAGGGPGVGLALGNCRLAVGGASGETAQL